MIKRGLSGILIFLLVFNLASSTVLAEELDETISAMQQQEAQTQATISDLEKQTQETKEAISQLEGQQKQTQQNVSTLQNQSTSLQSTINGYNSQLNTLDKEITETESAMAEVSSEIVELEKQLQQAQSQEQDRYNLLKKRMQSTYESGGTQGLLQILLISGTLQEFLTKFEYLDAIIRYDKRKISEYQTLQNEISAKKAVVEQKESELDKYQTKLDEKHDELAQLTDTVKGQLTTTNTNLSSERNKLANYDQQLKELDKKMKALESQTAAAQAKLAQQIAERLTLTREDTSGSYDASDEELMWLAATIQAEAGGESYTGKLAVGSVIMNRVKSSAFPNTIVEVITQNLQFASYRSGKVSLIMSNGPNSTCVNAAREVLNGARVGDYLFFMTQYWADYYCISEYTMIGNHAFFYRWVTKPKPEPVPEESQDSPDNPEPEQPSEETPSEETPSEETPSEEEPSEEPPSEEENGDYEDTPSEEEP